MMKMLANSLADHRAALNYYKKKTLRTQSHVQWAKR